jgi:hypothetical protein
MWCDRAAAQSHADAGCPVQASGSESQVLRPRCYKDPRSCHGSLKRTTEAVAGAAPNSRAIPRLGPPLKRRQGLGRARVHKLRNRRDGIPRPVWHGRFVASPRKW